MLVTVSLWSQAPLLFSSRLNVTNVTGSDPYTLTGVVQDELSLWSAADINAANDSIYHLEGSDLLIYRITSISSASGNNFVIIVDDIMNSGILPSTGTEWAAVEFTVNSQFPSYIGNLSSPFKAVIDNRFKQRLDVELLPDSANAIPLAPPIDFGGVVTTHVQEALEAINEKLDTLSNLGLNDGRILYVSKLFGNNATAEVGNPQRPWRDPWAARNSVLRQAGDLIYVRSGKYVISPTWGDVTATANARLWFDGTMYFDNGAVLMDSIGGPIFTPTSTTNIAGQTFKVLGKGVFKQTGVATAFTILGGFSGAWFGNAKEFYFEADTVICKRFIYINDSITNVGCSVKYLSVTEGGLVVQGYVSGTDFTVKQMDIIGSGSSGQDPFDLGNSNLKNTVINIDIERVNYYKTSGFSAINPTSVSDSIFVNIHIGRFYFDKTSSIASGGSKLLGALSGANHKNGYFKMSIDYIVDYSLDSLPLLQVPAKFLNHFVEINIGNGFTTNGLLYKQTDAITDSVFIAVNVNRWVQKNAKPCVYINANATTSSLTFSGEYESNAAPFWVKGDWNKFKIKDASLRSYGESPLVTDYSLQLQNCIFIGKTGASNIRNSAVTPVNVFNLSTASNLNSTDADIVLKVSPINIDSGLK